MLSGQPASPAGRARRQAAARSGRGTHCACDNKQPPPLLATRRTGLDYGRSVRLELASQPAADSGGRRRVRCPDKGGCLPSVGLPVHTTKHAAWRGGRLAASCTLHRPPLPARPPSEAAATLDASPTQPSARHAIQHKETFPKITLSGVNILKK